MASNATGAAPLRVAGKRVGKDGILGGEFSTATMENFNRY
jgi:hypothetical protein